MSISYRSCIAAGILATAVVAAGPSHGQVSEAFDVLITPAIFNQDYDSFGHTIAAGDYNGDGVDDFAVFAYNYNGDVAPGGLFVARGAVPHSVGSSDFLEGTGDERFGEGVAFGDFEG